MASQSDEGRLSQCPTSAFHCGVPGMRPEKDSEPESGLTRKQCCNPLVMSASEFA